MQPLAVDEHAGQFPPAVLVFNAVHTMGEHHSNPVLELLQDVDVFVQGRKYPQPALTFGDDRWRVYYHSHSPADSDAAEHGHFHLFTRHGQSWAHLAALSMDREGQPLRWFMTNRWVTGSDWGERGVLLASVDVLVAEDEPDVLRGWLASLLKLYRDELGDLLEVRDARVAERLRGRNKDEVLDDRSLYELANRPVDVAAKLISQLTGEGP